MRAAEPDRDVPIEVATIIEGSRTADEHILVMKGEGIMAASTHISLCRLPRLFLECARLHEGCLRYHQKELEMSTHLGQGGMLSWLGDHVRLCGFVL